MPAAYEVTVLETLALLDGEHSGLAQGVARRDYALWLGSGISLDRIVGVRGVIARVLDYLLERIDPADANCRHRRARDQILDELTDPERALVELDKPVEEWPEASARAVLGRLAGKYSQVLNTRLDGEQDEDFLLWTAVDVPNCFTSEDPDVEHLCIVMLAMEGVFTDVSSANWDYLIEAAERDLAGEGALLDICITANDFQAAAAPAKLLKFHGCAVRAVNDAPTYRSLLIARQPQIVNYHNNLNFGAMRHHLLGLIHQRRTLMIGFSAEDVDVQQMFGDAQANSQWSWDNPSPACVFAEEQLSQGQKLVLEFVYPDDYQANRADIEAAARCRAYGKPLLLALLLETYTRKLQTLCDLAIPAAWPEEARTAFHAGLSHLRDKAAAAADPDRLGFTRDLAISLSNALKLYHVGRPDAANLYQPISTGPVQQLQAIPASTGLRQASALLALLGIGDADGTWTVETAGASLASLSLAAADRTTPLFIAANDDAAVTMIADGLFDPDSDDAVLVMSASPAIRRQRSPVGAPGRTGRHAVREVSMSSLIAVAGNDAEMLDQFKQAAAL